MFDVIFVSLSSSALNICSFTSTFSSLPFEVTNLPQSGVCSDKICHGSLMNIRRMKAVPRSSSEILRQAKDFLKEYYASLKKYVKKDIFVLCFYLASPFEGDLHVKQ